MINSALSMKSHDEQLICQDIIPKEQHMDVNTRIQPVRSMTCYICFDNIQTTNKKFGIQNNCDHIFCFDCLLKWRRMSLTIDKTTGRRCPICRTQSTFITPSWRCFDNSIDKQILIDEHKLRLKKIPCRILFRHGHCRFGRRCYYSHNSNLQSLVYETQLNNVEQHEASREFSHNIRRYRPY